MLNDQTTGINTRKQIYLRISGIRAYSRVYFKKYCSLFYSLFIHLSMGVYVKENVRISSYYQIQKGTFTPNTQKLMLSRKPM